MNQYTLQTYIFNYLYWKGRTKPRHCRHLNLNYLGGGGGGTKGNKQIVISRAVLQRDIIIKYRFPSYRSRYPTEN